MDQKITVMIPARGGSKGLPRKNLRSLAGTPLLGHSLIAAKGSAYVSEIYISTDDDFIDSYAANHGVGVLRHPAELSADDRPSFPVIQWMVSHLTREGRRPDLCVILRATAPLRTSYDIDSAIELYRSRKGIDSVASVVSAVGINPTKLKRVLPAGFLVDALEPEGPFPTRRQDGGDYYVRNEAIYVVRPKVIESGSLWGEKCVAYLMPEERSININTEFQFTVADLIMRSRTESRLANS